MSASHLVTLGLPQLIAHDLPAYERLSVELARVPSKLAEMKQRLKYGLDNSPLMDTGGFTRNLETAFTMIWRRYCTGQTPEKIDLT